MNKMNNYELQEVYGGISGTLIKAITELYQFIYELGQTAGSAIRRKKEEDYC